MLTKHHSSFFIVVEDEGYLCADKVIMKYYGRHYVDRIGKQSPVRGLNRKCTHSDTLTQSVELLPIHGPG